LSFENPTAQQQKKTTQLNKQLHMSIANVDLKHSFQQEHISTQILFAFNLTGMRAMVFTRSEKRVCFPKTSNYNITVRAVHEE